MHTNNRVLSALRISHPDEWRAKVRAALRSEGSITGAAAVLSVDRVTLFRWIKEHPALKEGIDLPNRPGPRPKKE